MTRQEWYEHCVENNLCVSCHKPVDNGKRMCSSCSEKRRERDQARRRFYLATGICPRCGKNEIIGDEKICLECAAKKAEQDSKRDSKKIYRYTKKRRTLLKAQGRCQICGAKLDDARYSSCPSCREKRRKNYADRKTDCDRDQRIMEGRCYICGSPDLVDGKRLCRLCYKRSLKRAEEMHKARRKDKDNG